MEKWEFGVVSRLKHVKTTLAVLSQGSPIQSMKIIDNPCVIFPQSLVLNIQSVT